MDPTRQPAYPLCGGKTRYPSRGAALAVRRGLHARLRVYRCPDCGGYHLTKMAEEGRTVDRYRKEIAER